MRRVQRRIFPTALPQPSSPETVEMSSSPDELTELLGFFVSSPESVLTLRVRHWHGIGDYDDRVRSLWRVLPPPTARSVSRACCVIVTYKHVDQGWGNRKSMVYIGEHDSPMEALTALSADVADHLESEVRSVCRLRPDRADRWLGPSGTGVPFSAYVGGGGGHQLTLLDFCMTLVPPSVVPEMFYVLRQVRILTFSPDFKCDEATTKVIEECTLLRNVARLPDGPLMLLLSFVAPLDMFVYLARIFRPCEAA
jgi:hypothetical protein